MAKVLYHTLADYHDLLTGRNYGKESDMINDIFKKYGANINSILDLACGTGKHMRYLTQKGYAVTGIDLSQDMLTVARSNSPESKTIMGDVRTMSFFKKKFDAAIFMGTTFNYLLTDKDFIRFRNRLYDNIEQLIILDTTNFSNENNLKEIFDEPQTFEDTTAIFNSVRNVRFKNGYRHLLFHHKVYYKKSHKVIEYDDEAIGRLYLLDKVNQLMNNKFKLVIAFGEYDISIPYAKNSRRLIAVYQKQ